MSVLAFGDLLAWAQALLGLTRADLRALNGTALAKLRDDDGRRRGPNPAWMAKTLKLRRG